MSKKYIYKINPLKSSIIDVIGSILSIVFIIIWTYILLLFGILGSLSTKDFHTVFTIIFYSIMIYGSLFYIFIYSFLNIKRSCEYLYISNEGFKLPRSKIIEFIKKKNDYIEFKDIVKHEYVWYGVGCNIFLKNKKEIFISPDNCGIDGYIKICEILEKRNPSPSTPNMDLVKKWFELKREGWKRRKEERELFEMLRKKNSKFS